MLEFRIKFNFKFRYDYFMKGDFGMERGESTNKTFDLTKIS